MLTEQPSARATTLGERIMAIGAVTLSVPIAFLSSCWMSMMNGFELWQGFAAYSAVGTLTMMLYLVTSALETVENRTL